VRKLVGELADDGVDDTPSGAVMAGDSIAFRATTDLAKVQEQLGEMLDDLAQAAQADFSFIDALEPLRNKQAVVGKLEDLLGATVLQNVPKDNELAGLDQHCLEFAPPDEVRMDEVEDFVITYHDKEHVFDNASLPGIRAALTAVGVKRGHTYLRQARIMARAVDGSPASQALPVIHWLVFEVGSSTERFVLTLGRWFKLSEDYAKKLNVDLKRIKDVTADLGLPTWDTNAGDEGKYNEEAAAADSNLVLMDKVKVTPSEGGYVEACDLLQKDGYLIHVKRYNKSQTLSHLFSQAYVSVELLRTDDAYKDDFVTKVTDRDAGFTNVAKEAPQRVTFAIGLADDRDLPLGLPIFSKVNLRDHVKRIKVAGVEPTIARIAMI
jgi:uncharacterized protein (TIGR04141 family)